MSSRLLSRGEAVQTRYARQAAAIHPPPVPSGTPTVLRQVLIVSSPLVVRGGENSTPDAPELH